VHCGVSKGVLFGQGRVVIFIRMFVARFIVRPCDTSEPALEGWAPATLTLVSVVKTNDAHKYGALGEVGTKSAPKRVPLAGFVSGAGYL
jgi:hypothetical protein